MKYLSSPFTLRAATALFLSLSVALRAQEPPAKADPPPAPAAPAPAPAPAADTTAPAATPSQAPAADATATTPAAAPTEPAAASQPAPAPEAQKSESELRRIDTTTTEPAPEARESRRSHRRGPGNDIPFGDHVVAKGNRVNDAISVMGSTTIEGEVGSDAVSVLGQTTIAPGGKVGGDAVAVLGRVENRGTIAGDVVSVMGGVYIDGAANHDVVAVMCNVELGPKAEIGGDLVLIGGTLKKDPQAVVRGNEVRVPVVGGFSGFDGVATWFKRCFMLGRPLAFGPHLGWAWMVAAGFLAFYVVLALLFPRGIVRCAETLENQPGSSILASLLTVLLSPVAIVLLAITVVGAILVPFLAAGLLIAGLFGKAVMLGWLGRRFTKYFGDGPLGHPAFAVLIGGILVMLLYTLWGSFIIYKLLSWIGLGVVVYTIMLSMRREKPVVVASGVAAGVPPVAPAPAAAYAAQPKVSPFAAVPPMVAEGLSGPSTIPQTIPPMGSATVPNQSAGFVGGSAEAAAVPAYGAVPPQTPPVATMPPAPASTLPRAGFFLRLGALLIDFILLAFLLMFVSQFMPRALQFNNGPGGLFLAMIVYSAIMWKLKGTTIGGIVCSLKVVRIDNREIDWPTAIVRSLGCLLSFVVAGLGFIWVAIDSDRQSWHDKIAGTTVVVVPKGVSLL